MLDSQQLCDSGAHACHAIQMTANDAPVIIEAALNGVTTRAHNPTVPATAEEQAKDALGCVDAGATVIHAHAPNIAVPPDEAAEQYAIAFRPVVERYPGVVCYPTTGIGKTIEDRYGHVELLDDMGLVRAGFVDTGSVNLGGTGPDGLLPNSTFVYTNTFADIAYKMDVCRERGLGPSIAIFEPGFLRVVRAYYDAGALPAGTLVKFYFSAGGYLGGGQPLWGAPPIMKALDLYLAMLGDAEIAWAVAVLGGPLLDTPVARAALERGGHLRVGLEDWDSGPANVEQVTAAAKLCRNVGRDVAGVADAARVLGLSS
jgi:3-keto-5-aminohexanoate cleavage enzyme